MAKDILNKSIILKIIIINKTNPINNDNLYKAIPFAYILTIVTIKLMALIKNEAPAICKLKMAKSTAGPEWATTPESGGYNVQPVPAPTSATLESNSNTNEGINSQKLILFKRGKAISGAPISKGTNQLPKPPIIAGITMKKIIIKA